MKSPFIALILATAAGLVSAQTIYAPALVVPTVQQKHLPLAVVPDTESVYQRNARLEKEREEEKKRDETAWKSNCDRPGMLSKRDCPPSITTTDTTWKVPMPGM